MGKRTGTILFLTVILCSMTACAGFQPEISGSQTASGSAASGQAVRDAAEKQEYAETKKKIQIKYPAERKDVTAALQISQKKQVDIICREKENWYKEGKTRYALTDLDQDGYLEIFVADADTLAAIFEVKENGDGIEPWQIPDEKVTFSENPMCVYWDKEKGIWHLDVTGGREPGQTAGTDGRRYDLAVRDNSMRAVEYKDADKTFQGMTKRYMWFDTEEISFEDCREELSYMEFQVEAAWDIQELEHRISAGEREQLRIAAGEIDKDPLLQNTDFVCGRFYAVTDFNRDGQVECLVATMLGSGIVRSYYSLYEVSTEKEELARVAYRSDTAILTKEGLFGGFVTFGIGEKLEAWQDNQTGQYYYVFNGGMSYDEHEETKRYQFSLKRHCFELTEWQALSKTAVKRADIHIRWMDSISTACEDYRYENLLVSWLGFGE